MVFLAGCESTDTPQTVISLNDETANTGQTDSGSDQYTNDGIDVPPPDRASELDRNIRDLEEGSDEVTDLAADDEEQHETDADIVLDPVDDVVMPGEPTSCPVVEGFDFFITRGGDQLMEGDNLFRFVSFNIPNLHVIEDNGWHLPDPWEQEDALCSIVQMGGQVVRIYVLSVGESRHVTGPGEFDEDLFVALDQAISLANRYGVRLIIPFVDQWDWWGGIEEYASFRGLTGEDFWTDPQLIEDFKKTVEFIVTRVNTVTGVPYRDDKAILAWETGNELSSPTDWTLDMAQYIRGLDPNHLILDGHFGIDEAVLDSPYIDIVSNHYYWPPGFGDRFADAALSDWDVAEGRRPFIIGEFGIVSTDRIQELVETVVASEMSGVMIWSLRFRDVNGGYYFHTEYDDGDTVYGAYHWPGFESNSDWDEIPVIDFMREQAFSIRGLEEPPLNPPLAPVLFPIDSTDAISWRGATGAGWYSLERADATSGPWVTVVDDFHDAVAPNTALVSDPTAVPGESYYYRITGHNDGGSSPPSLMEGPVVGRGVLVDELSDMSLIDSHTGGLFIDSTNISYFQGDEGRLARTNTGAEQAVWMVEGSITDILIETYFWPWEPVSHFTFEGSTDGEEYYPLPISEEGGEGDWIKQVYSSYEIPEGTRLLRVQFNNLTGTSWTPQIGRLEIGWVP
jgi:hypothetical protein